MNSKREEERNEKVIRGLLKLPPNRRCINCNALGPQYVCTNFWTFVCTACSGIHREFTHRVKSVSMAKFTSQEVEALQNGGNQRARELFLIDWDMQNMKLPDSSYPDKIRDFIKNVYVDKKYAVGRSSDKPPRDPQGLKSHEEHRRASSYHSFSQSPPYDHQYEDRRYGKPRNMLSRKPGSDHGHYEANISSILSPDRDREHVYEDRFANESSSSRISDFSRSSGLSPSAYSNPSSQQISPSLGTFGSFDSKTTYPKSTSFCTLSDMVSEPEHISAKQPPNNSTISPQEASTPQTVPIIDLFSPQFLQQQTTKISTDFFADSSNQPSCTSPSEKKPSSAPLSENEGWAMFDFIHQVAPDPETNKSLPLAVPPYIEEPVEIIDRFSSKQDTSQMFSAQRPAALGKLASTTEQWHADFPGILSTQDSSSMPVWNAFDDSFENRTQSFYANSSRSHVMVNGPGPTLLGCQYDVALPKVLDGDGLQFPVVLDKDLQILTSCERIPSVTLPCEVRSAHEGKSINPFDLSYDSEVGAKNKFLDMSSLQSGLPKPQLPNSFFGDLSEPWFQQSSASNFSPSIPQASLPFGGSQTPSTHLPNIPSQGSAASGNPFA